MTIEELLNNFTDTELAYLYKYQLDRYLVDSQAKIKKFIFEKRALTQAALDDLIRKNTDKKIISDIAHCPRCKTDKLRKEKFDEKQNIICNVCGYVLPDRENNNKQLRENLTDFFFDFLSEI
jgi:Zn ribbon nucleic-acid-binding protein